MCVFRRGGFGIVAVGGYLGRLIETLNVVDVCDIRGDVFAPRLHVICSSSGCSLLS